MDETNKRAVTVLSEEGTTLLAMYGLGRDGDRMVVEGAIMGSWPTKMYVAPQDVKIMIRFLLNRQVIGYVLSLPFLLRKQKTKPKSA